MTMPRNIIASLKKIAILLPLALCVLLAGCAGKHTVSEPLQPVPLPPQVATKHTTAVKPEMAAKKKNAAKTETKAKAETKAEPESTGKEEEKVAFASPAYEEDATGHYIVVSVTRDKAEGPRQGEPSALAELLEMKSEVPETDTAVSLMRPLAIREAAQLVTIQTAISWRYKRLLAETERHAAIMDTAFDFSPLLMTHGDALIMPPVLTRAGASMRLENPETATVAKASYELLAPARYVAAAPSWREYMMVDSFPEPEKPNPAVMPKDTKERAIWRSAVREAWEQGIAEADQLYADNVARMVRQYRGIMLYHLLTAQHLLSRVNTASAEFGSK